MPKSYAWLATYNDNIFINCPFDDSYRPFFDALVFAAFDFGYVPRCALEIADSGEARIEKIVKIVDACRLGVHDISRTSLDSKNHLPRFNMPFELGLFIGAAKFGVGHQRQKNCLILDTERYRFQKFLSDVAGQDIYAHHDQPDEAIKALRDWLSADNKGRRLPGGASTVKRYHLFLAQMPDILARLELEPAEVSFGDYANIVAEWLVEQPRPNR